MCSRGLNKLAVEPAGLQVGMQPGEATNQPRQSGDQVSKALRRLGVQGSQAARKKSGQPSSSPSWLRVRDGSVTAWDSIALRKEMCPAPLLRRRFSIEARFGNIISYNTIKYDTTWSNIIYYNIWLLISGSRSPRTFSHHASG